MYHFYDLDDRRRNTYLTRLRSRRLVTQVNISAYYHNFDNNNGFGVLEDVVVNHSDISAITHSALNTMRMITLIGDDGRPNLLFAAQKFGMHKRIVDVFGMHAPINLKTGRIDFPFHSGDITSTLLFERHPSTGKSLKDFSVPMFQEAKEMILDIAPGSGTELDAQL